MTKEKKNKNKEKNYYGLKNDLYIHKYICIDKYKYMCIMYLVDGYKKLETHL